MGRGGEGGGWMEVLKGKDINLVREIFGCLTGKNKIKGFSQNKSEKKPGI